MCTSEDGGLSVVALDYLIQYLACGDGPRVFTHSQAHQVVYIKCEHTFIIYTSLKLKRLSTLFPLLLFYIYQTALNNF
jgi:hypothetical protein